MHRSIPVCARTLILGLLLLAFACQRKTVTIRTTPPESDLTITRLRGEQVEEVHRTAKAPLRIALPFGEGITYRVRASKDQHDSAEAVIGPDPQQTVIDLVLKQYATNTEVDVFEPSPVEEASQEGGEALRLAVKKVTAEAYLDTREESGRVTACTPLPSTAGEGIPGLHSLAASRAEKRIVYDVIKALEPEKYHVVDRNETLEEIATLYNLSTRDLRRLNGHIAEPLDRGRRLKVAEQKMRVEMFVQNTDSAAATRLEQEDGLHLFPSFSHNGSAVVFTSDYLEAAGLTRNLWSVSWSANARTLLYQPHSNWQLYAPSAATDGTIAFTCLIPRQPTPHVWSLKPGAKSPDQLTTDGECQQMSPDGMRILFIRRFPQPDKLTGPGQVWVMQANGNDPRPLTKNRDYTITSARWSPDGQWIAYASNQGRKTRKPAEPDFDIWLMRGDGTGSPVQLTTNSSWDDCPAWDRNGETIYFRSNRGGQWRIWQMDLDKALLRTP